MNISNCSLCALIWHSKAQWSLYVPPGLKSTNTTFGPLSVFMCFVWIWEQTAIISLYSINWLVFLTEVESVYCAVRHKPDTFRKNCGIPALLSGDAATSQKYVSTPNCTASYIRRTYSKSWYIHQSIDNLVTPESFMTYIYTGCSKSSFNQLTLKLLRKQLHLKFSA